MVNVTDILTDPATGDLACKNGDLVMGDGTFQHQSHLLTGFPGHYGQFPTITVGLENFINDEDPTEMLRQIRRQFTNDGMQISQLKYTDRLIIKAQYV